MMRLLILITWIVFILPLLSQEVDHEARREISILKQRITALEERHNDLKELIRENISETKAINGKVDKLIFGENGTGLNEKVAINTKFRAEIEKLIWVFITALVGQFALFMGAILKIRKLINLVK